MATNIEESTSTIYCDAHGLHVGRLDFSNHPGLLHDIEVYKWCESANYGEPGFDMGLIPAVVGYFVENPERLRHPQFAYLFEDQTSDSERAHDACIFDAESRNIQRVLLPLEFRKNRYYLSEAEGHDVGDETAEQDFIFNRAMDYGKRARVALCACICCDAPYCKAGQRNLRRFLERK